MNRTVNSYYDFVENRPDVFVYLPKGNEIKPIDMTMTLYSSNLRDVVKDSRKSLLPLKTSFEKKKKKKN